MPFALIFIGLIALVTGVRGTWREFLGMLRGDLTGTNNFLYWLVAIMALGALGYVPRLRPISDAFLVLVVVVLFLSHKGFFNQFQSAVNSTAVTTNTNDVNYPSSASNSSNGITLTLGGFYHG